MMTHILCTNMLITKIPVQQIPKRSYYPFCYTKIIGDNLPNPREVTCLTNCLAV